MQIAAAESRLIERFGNASRVGDSALQTNYRAGDKTVASYWFDFSDKLPETNEALQSYSDRVIGPSYFSESISPDLRWNYYLYFVAGARTRGLDSERAKDIKELIESDRSFARKFVIDDTCFNQVIDGIGSVSNAARLSNPIENIAEVWRGKLTEKDLAFLLDDLPLTEKLRMVAQAPTKNVRRSRVASPSDLAAKLSGSAIESLDISGYRSCPIQRKFDGLGKANLIFGMNGVGKTSLLEAIEYFYCGGNRRNPLKAGYTVSAKVAGLGLLSTGPKISLNESRGRLRSWYGLSDTSNHNPLPAAFGRFNFMDVDAAAALMIRGPEREELIKSLKQLIGGEETTVQEVRLTKSREGISSEVAKRRNELKAITAQLEAATAEYTALRSRPSEADADTELLASTLAEIGWPHKIERKSDISIAFLQQLSDYGSLISRAQMLAHDAGGVTVGILKDSVVRLEEDRRLVEVELERLKTLEQDLIVSQRMLSSGQASAADLERWTAERANSVLGNARALAQTEQALVATTREVTGFSIALNDEEIAIFGDMTIDGCIDLLSLEIDSLRSKMSLSQQRLQEVKRTQDSIDQLVSQLVLVSRMVMDHTRHDDHCPLCGQDYDPETLQERISSLESSVRGGASVALELEIENHRSALERQGRLLREIRSLKMFAQSAGMSDGTVSSVLRYYRLAVLENARLVAEQERLTKLSRDAEVSGFSVIGLLKALGVESVPEVVEQREIDSLLGDTQRVISELPAYIGAVRAGAMDATDRIRLICAKYGLTADPMKSVGVGLDAKHQELRDVIREIEEVSERTQIDSARSLGALESLVKAALLQALRVEETKSVEAASNSRMNALQETIARLQTAKDAAEIVVERLSDGLGVVTEILEKSSLAEATEAAMSTVHDVADGVFSRIHTPSEYKINAAIESPLLRKGSEDLIDLSEVSSGQRAAYALSIFIAMNAEAQKSPKVMLLDDPIAHIDDLNALSFLDYLRDIVLNADRQVFFATADDRIAGLFAHKFGFLGKDFKTIELDR